MSDPGPDPGQDAAHDLENREAAPPSHESHESLRSMLRGALREEEPPPNVLAGVQKRIRERSNGKFYADGWSTAKHPPLNTYLVTSLIMLTILAISYALLSPLVGAPVPVRNQPVPVQVIPR
ncbi:MAG TPA: hypothetical protein VFK05_11490 [Polyangiaceae bacterium]|nr:hypothetical protein [Polyangiaceae bacterium]